MQLGTNATALGLMVCRGTAGQGDGSFAILTISSNSCTLGCKAKRHQGETTRNEETTSSISKNRSGNGNGKKKQQPQPW